MDLHELAGNAGLKQQLRHPQSLSHALILSGELGSGRHTLARLLAQAMLCTGSDAVPCGHCTPCKKIQEGIHPDVPPLSTFLKSDDSGRDLKVYAVRSLREDAQIRPNESQYKIYIIDLPINVQAQNAMLKLLEDGPAYAVFLIITENAAALLETVRSRCGELHLNRITQPEALDYLRRRYPNQPPEALAAAAARCEGLLGSAVAALEHSAHEDVIAPLLPPWVDALCRKSELALMECAANAETQKWKRELLASFYAGMEQLFHHALVAQLTGRMPDDDNAHALAQALSRQQLCAGEKLSAQARLCCAFNPGLGHSLGAFAVALYQLFQTN